VYPDEREKPPQGEGLNRTAEITLERIYPTDKMTREPITDVDRLAAMRFGAQLERKTSKMGAAFKDYRPDVGVWVFEVKHFSKYGLTSDDEDEDDAPVTQLDRLRRDERTHGRVQRVKIETENLVPDVQAAVDLSYDTQELITAMTNVEENLVEFKATTMVDDEALLEHLHERAARLRFGGLVEEPIDVEVDKEETMPVLRRVRALPNTPHVVLDERTPHKCNRAMQPKLPEREVETEHVKAMFAIVRETMPDDQGGLVLAVPMDKEGARLFDRYAQVAQEHGALSTSPPIPL